ncbi:IclR family transcriptional regulator [Nocardia donostiensis]|uniref:IclR family transcriptional regulator n=1 Tax=Nocardia donostiensis TaxID=1538463 RepID=A0A1W0B166_9NOCA|nr:IclR family transcriptional regulator [Nocardia donostiensis]ONM46756.1 IclR family transcriptional regulator [Nocardia donostiensis]OQS16230.1 IclR family transcriptional regulator [Nocardia donostiensis]OQS19624.1 IclR family transcriptional regulator [Nocardia donostiensis]
MPTDRGHRFGVDRAALLLDAFEGSDRLTLAQLVHKTGLPRSSAHRMLDRLVQLRWLHREDGYYELGTRLLELGSLALHQSRLHQAALPFLHELHRVTGHVVHLAVLDGSDVVYLEKLGWGLAARLPSRVGWRQPAVRTSVGKAILAHLSPDELDRILAVERRPHRTRAGPLDVRRMHAELARVRDRGVSIDHGETVHGIGCLGTPVGATGAVIAAVSVCGPISEVPADYLLAGPLRFAAQGIWRRYKDRGPGIAPGPRSLGSVTP